MDHKQCLQLIEEYRKFDHLWNPKNKLHHSRIKREEAWVVIGAALDHPVPDLQSKMKTLMGTYRSERSREKTKSMLNGSAYKSKWFAYEALQFLDNKNLSNSDQNEMETNVDLDDNEEGESSEQKQTDEEKKERPPPVVLSLLPASKSLALHRYSKRAREKESERKSAKKKQKLIEGDTTEREPKLEPNSVATSNGPAVAKTNDEHDEVTSFFAFVAAKVKKYSSRTRNAVEHAIFDILKKADADGYESSQ